MITERIQRKARDAADKKWQKKIYVSPAIGLGIYNNSCMYNAVNKCMSGESAAVVECVVVDSDKVTAHYINMQEDGSFIDYTLGWHYSGCDYRLVRYVPQTEWGSINRSLINLKKKICEPVKRVKSLFCIDDNDIC